MATSVDSTTRLFADAREVDLARDLLGTLAGPAGYLSVGRDDVAPHPVAPEVGRLIQQVLEALASGSTVTVSAVPSEVTTSTAAAMLGISRPTLMKMVRDGTIPAHKVGTHTRLRTEDVHAALRARRERERAAFAALLELEGDED